MTQEVRITVDANLYCRHADWFLIDEAKFEWKKRITDFFKANAFADHKFVDVKVDIIPHENDRDYTEEDAEKHLNGEPKKKRKTYAEDFFEKFPNAPFVRVGILDPHDVPVVHFWDVYGIDEMKKYMENPLMAFGDTLVMGGVSNDLWMKEKPEDADA